jgi:hypothetical protein
MTFLLIIAIIIGILQSRTEIYNVRHGLSQGVPESNNLIDFIFLNK